MQQTLTLEPQPCTAAGGQQDNPAGQRQPELDIRHAGPDALAQALQASRHDTLDTFQRWERWLGPALPTVRVPADLNPPLWERGHVG